MENLEEEIWLPIKGYEGFYMISNKSRFKSCTRIVFTHNVTRTKILSSQIIKKGIRGGYPTINLWKDNKIITVATHRLLAEHFIANPDNLHIVEHKNDIKQDDSIDNLMWSTTVNNVTNGHYRSSKHSIKQVIQYDLNGNFVNEFESISKASFSIKGNNTGSSQIQRNCSGKSNSAYGFNFKYK